MSLPSFDYSRPGLGLSKEQVENERYRFFKIFFRKFLKLVAINMLYFVSVIMFFLPVAAVITAKNPGSRLLFYISMLPITFTGPMTAGFVFVIRGFTRQEHVFLWHDYWNAIKSNWKQAIGVGFISVVLFIFAYTAFNFYYNQMLGNIVYLAPLIILCIISVCVLFMHYYIYLLMITFKLKLKQIYRNAFAFSLINPFRNTLISVSLFLMVLLCWIIPVMLLLIPFLLLSTFGLIATYNAWPAIQKHMIDSSQKDMVNDPGHHIFKDF